MEPSGAMLPAVRARSLVKRYGRLLAVDGVDFEAGTGESLGILGPQGAGKTTMLRMICGHTPMTSGEIEVLGLSVREHPRKVKARMGFVPQGEDLEREFTVLENLTVYGRYFGLGGRECRRRAAELLSFLELDDRCEARPDGLSHAARRRLLIARALIHAPAVLLLDEPTAGLDSQARLGIRERLRALRRSGTTVIFATRDAREAAGLANRLLVADHGKILESGSPEDLVTRYAAGDVLDFAGSPEALLAFATAAGLGHHAGAGRLILHSPDGQGEALRRDIATRFPAEQPTLRRGNLDDVFLRLTGRVLPDGSDAG